MIYVYSNISQLVSYISLYGIYHNSATYLEMYDLLDGFSMTDTMLTLQKIMLKYSFMFQWGKTLLSYSVQKGNLPLSTDKSLFAL